MEDILKAAVGQAPGLVVLCVLVWLFLKRDKERDSFIKDLHDEHIGARTETRIAIEKNTESNLAVCRAVDKLSVLWDHRNPPRSTV